MFKINEQGGPVTKEDYELLYQVENGAITPYPLSVHISPGPNYANIPVRRGIFNQRMPGGGNIDADPNGAPLYVARGPVPPNMGVVRRNLFNRNVFDAQMNEAWN